MDHRFCNNELQKLFGSCAASNRNHCVTHRPNLNMYLNCLIFGKFFYPYVFQYFQKRPCQNRARQNTSVYSLYKRHTKRQCVQFIQTAHKTPVCTVYTNGTQNASVYSLYKRHTKRQCVQFIQTAHKTPVCTVYTNGT
jgi:hypothetical protein